MTCRFWETSPSAWWLGGLCAGLLEARPRPPGPGDRPAAAQCHLLAARLSEAPINATCLWSVHQGP